MSLSLADHMALDHMDRVASRAAQAASSNTSALINLSMQQRRTTEALQELQVAEAQLYAQQVMGNIT